MSYLNKFTRPSLNLVEAITAEHADLAVYVAGTAQPFRRVHTLLMAFLHPSLAAVLKVIHLYFHS